MDRTKSLIVTGFFLFCLGLRGEDAVPHDLLDELPVDQQISYYKQTVADLFREIEGLKAQIHKAALDQATLQAILASRQKTSATKDAKPQSQK